MYDEIGGFNPDTPQDQMDVEYSYYVESKNWKIGNIPNVHSITVKTLPDLNAIANENTLALHPLTLKNSDKYTTLALGLSQKCNVCNTENNGGVFNDSEQCLNCLSSPIERSLMKLISESQMPYRKLKLYSNISYSKTFMALLNKMFNVQKNFRRNNEVCDIVLFDSTIKTTKDLKDLIRNKRFKELFLFGDLDQKYKNDKSIKVSVIQFYSESVSYLNQPIYKLEFRQ